MFEPDRATIGNLPPNTPMTFTVTETDKIVFLEQSADGRTWSNIVARRHCEQAAS